MSSLLFSNIAPLRTKFPKYVDYFSKLLAQSEHVQIASGYMSTDSAIDLESVIKANGRPHLNICLGMHYFDGFSRTQLDAIKSLDATLRDAKLGSIFLVTTFPYHGKLVSFNKSNNVFSAIIGSSNMSNIIDGNRQYEADYLCDESRTCKQISDFMLELTEKCSQPLLGLPLVPNNTDEGQLRGQIGVTKIPAEELKQYTERISDISFKIPLKASSAPASNLNTYFGKGRENKQGYVIPRSWYEVELIVPNTITCMAHYPQANTSSAVFDVVTDDGWSFPCKVSGDYSKNLRSEGDLKVLGRWIKGRLENAGVLKPGNPVTDKTLREYGKNEISMSKIENSNIWYLNFGVSK